MTYLYPLFTKTTFFLPASVVARASVNDMTGCPEPTPNWSFDMKRLRANVRKTIYPTGSINALMRVGRICRPTTIKRFFLVSVHVCLMTPILEITCPNGTHNLVAKTLSVQVASEQLDLTRLLYLVNSLLEFGL